MKIKNLYYDIKTSWYLSRQENGYPFFFLLKMFRKRIAAGYWHMNYIFYKNKKAKRKLCDKCGGTGNETWNMYRKCEKCLGKGYLI